MSADAMSAPSAFPVRVEVDYPDRLSRGLIFIKWLLALPHYIILIAYAILMWFCAIAAIFIVLFTGTLPAGLWDFILGFDRWGLRVQAYVYLLTDKYPPFTNQPVDYPVRLQSEQPPALSRGLVLIKWLLAIPHFLILIVLGVVAIVVTIIAWFAILFTGKYPRGLFDLVEGYLRWQTRVNVYCGNFIAYNPYVGGLLRDEYPPFSLKA